MGKKVLFVAPGYGNGGIRSWTKKMLVSFNNERYTLVHVGIGYRRAKQAQCSILKRVIDGILDTFDDRRAVVKTLQGNMDIKLMHTTTSGSLGTFRDFVLAKCCKRFGVKTIMHCRYGCIPEDYAKQNLLGYLLRKTMSLYDNIWVLDTRSEKALRANPKLDKKVFLTPNSIIVSPMSEFHPKEYKNIAFIGNLIPSKGIYELINAVKKCSEDTILTIIGPGDQSTITHIKDLAGDLLDKRIKIVGSLPNEQAVEYMKSMDIIALPTYYPSEAFPISILEAMSYGKMVISTRRAAIGDMLTALDGSECGYFVREKSIEDIVEAINWCQTHTKEADNRCRKAYEKVYNSYRSDVIYELYRNLYTKLLSE